MQAEPENRDVINPDDPPRDVVECRQCLKYIPRDREDVSPFCSEECEEEWDWNQVAEYPDDYPVLDANEMFGF